MATGDPLSRLGRYVTKQHQGEAVRAFVPPPLPPIPAVDLARLQILLEQANQSIGRLETTGRETHRLFVYRRT